MVPQMLSMPTATVDRGAIDHRLVGLDVAHDHRARGCLVAAIENDLPVDLVIDELSLGVPTLAAFHIHTRLALARIWHSIHLLSNTGCLSIGG